MNDLAVKLSEMEGKKIQISIAQIKEVIRCLKTILSSADARKVFERYIKIKGKK